MTPCRSVRIKRSLGETDGLCIRYGNETNKYIISYYKLSGPPTRFGHTCGHPQGGAIKRDILQKFLNQYAIVRY